MANTIKMDLGVSDVEVPGAVMPGKRTSRAKRKNAKAKKVAAAASKRPGDKPSRGIGGGKGLRMKIGADGTIQVRHMSAPESGIVVLPSLAIALDG